MIPMALCAAHAAITTVKTQLESEHRKELADLPDDDLAQLHRVGVALHDETRGVLDLIDQTISGRIMARSPRPGPAGGGESPAGSDTPPGQPMAPVVPTGPGGTPMVKRPLPVGQRTAVSAPRPRGGQDGVSHMSFHLCGAGQHDGFPDAGEGACCMGAAINGPDHCTCWVPIYASVQSKPDETAGPGTRPEPCADCAYRPDSPERTGDPTVNGTDGELDRIVAEGSPFWCHQGIRRPLRWRHPSGVVVEGSDSDYKPPIIDGVPYKADGSPADLCAGWVARHAAHLRQLAAAP